MNCHLLRLFMQRKRDFFEVSELFCHANLTKLLLNETYLHPALAFPILLLHGPLCMVVHQQCLELRG